MNVKILFINILSILFIVSCSNSTAKDEGAKGTVFPIVYISLYSSNSMKVQPELINVQTDYKKINEALHWKDKAEEVSLPAIESIDQIYVFQFDYEVNKKVVRREQYMYVTDYNGNNYLKRYKQTSAFDVDKYNATSKKAILNRIGINNWHKVSPSAVLR